MTDCTVAQLAAELGVARRTLERAMRVGAVVPTGYVKGSRFGEHGHYYFGREYVEGLKCRANDAKSRGLKHVMEFITSTGTTTPPAGPSAQVWARQKAWKRKHATRRSSREVTLASALAQLVG